MSESLPNNEERTIEELLGWSLEKLEALAPKELEKWVTDAITRQDVLVKSQPAHKAAAARTGGGGASHKQPPQLDLSKLSPEMMDIMNKAQAAMAAALKMKGTK